MNPAILQRLERWRGRDTSAPIEGETNPELEDRLREHSRRLTLKREAEEEQQRQEHLKRLEAEEEEERQEHLKRREAEEEEERLNSWAGRHCEGTGTAYGYEPFEEGVARQVSKRPTLSQLDGETP